MIDIQDIKAKCSGRWHGILSNIGINVRTDGKHEPCCICGGIDRFRLDKDGSGYFCNQCGSGDTIQLIQKTNGWTFKETIKQVSQLIGVVTMDKTSDKQPDKAYVKEMLNKLWQSSVPLTGSCHVSKYLHSRGLVLQPDNVRYCPECYESDTAKHYPAMVARILNSKGVPVAIHRTYLDRDTPKKADIKSSKKMTPTLDSLVGGGVLLFEPKENIIIVCEGIETGIACKQIFDEGVCACLSNTLLEGYEPPEGIRQIIICGDNDAAFTGARSAYILANKLYKKDFIAEVKIPEESGDWNDVLMEGKQPIGTKR